MYLYSLFLRMRFLIWMQLTLLIGKSVCRPDYHFCATAAYTIYRIFEFPLA